MLGGQQGFEQRRPTCLDAWMATRLDALVQQAQVRGSQSIFQQHGVLEIPEALQHRHSSGRRQSRGDRSGGRRSALERLSAGDGRASRPHPPLLPTFQSFFSSCAEERGRRGALEPSFLLQEASAAPSVSRTHRVRPRPIRGRRRLACARAPRVCFRSA